jgi:hypothetical protein
MKEGAAGEVCVAAATAALRDFMDSNLVASRIELEAKLIEGHQALRRLSHITSLPLLGT